MKGILTIIICFTTFSITLAQTLSLGTEIGFISSINTDYTLTDLENRRNTYYSGINLSYKFSDRFSLTSGLIYLRQGYRHSTCYTVEEGVQNQLVGKIDYLAVPLLANLHFLNSRKMILTLGLLGAHNMKAVQVVPESIGGCEKGYIPDLKNTTQNFSMMGVIGLGYKLLEGRNFELISNVKYFQGLSNTYTGITQGLDRKYSSIIGSISFNLLL